MSTNLPSSDDVLERHQFYAAIHAEANATKENIDRIRETIARVHTRLDVANTAQIQLHDRANTTEVRNRTLALAVVIIWGAISGIAGWAWDKSSSKVEQYITKIELIENSVNDLKREKEKIAEDRLAVAALRRELKTMRDDFSEHASAINTNTKPQKGR
jgi:predicted nucleic acid binding AN1-type Zn finger protein